ncbi:MAG: phosphoserine phosphatase SerB [Zetaproteobacteria bacterium]|nr:MAG: phosphoserine phosphatase SerB [Zetaproteobacteria bacterium]
MTPSRPTLGRPGMLFMDMDSTLIRCECIDEIAAFLGIKPKVAAITRRAMEGELDFRASLIERVALLAGVETEVLDQVYHRCIQLNDGAETLIATLHRHGWKVGLVSGGFTWFTDRLTPRLGLDFAAANRLEIRDGRLTGRLLGRIVDADEKRRLLLQQRRAWEIAPEQCVAVGDGANDLPMLQAAALGIAFHAKPAVRRAADAAIDHGGLEQILSLLAPA